MPFIAYYRVSTDKQGISGLGLDAQRAAILKHVNHPLALVAEFTEVESGKKHTNRPQLTFALAECKKRKAVLAIAKLDRLARDVHFISGLQKTGVDFVCCDNPNANKTMIQMLAVFSEYEREQISERTKLALAQAKKRGKILGNPRLSEARERALDKIKAMRPDKAIVRLIHSWKVERKTLRFMAGELNKLNIKAPRGGVWYATSVKNFLASNPN